jgi:hypothetical protein
MRDLPMWAVLVVTSLLLGVILIAVGRGGDESLPDVPRSGPRACAAPRVAYTARETLRASETGSAVQPVAVQVVGPSASVTARGEVTAKATVEGRAPVAVTARAAARKCATGTTPEEAEDRAVRVARRAGRAKARREAERRLRETLPTAERRLRTRLRRRALREAARKARAAIPAERERLRAQARRRLADG